MAMDKKSILGFVAIFLIIIFMPYYYKAISKRSSPVPPTPTEEYTAEEIKTPRIADRTPGWHIPLEKAITDFGNVKILTVETDLYIARISSIGGGTFNSFILKNYEMRKDNDTTLVELINPNRKPPLLIKYISIDGDSVELNQNFQILHTDKNSEKPNHFRISREDSLTLSFALKSSNTVLALKTLTFHGNTYTISLNTDLTGLSNDIATEFYELSWNGGLSTTERLISDDIYYSKAYAYCGGEYDNINVKSGEKKIYPKDNPPFFGSTQWTAIRTKYFAASFLPYPPALGCKLEGVGIPLKGKDYIKIFNMHILLTKHKPSYTKLFVGPLDYHIVKGLSANLENIMNFGIKIIQPISKGILWIFIKLHTIIPNYGWVLIIFSILLKFVLTPLTNKSTRSMKEMQKLQPQIESIKAKHKSEPQKINAETMRLYKEHGVNPMGGCLPLLLQMPILFALFTIFRSTIELRHSPFIFWITDLSAPDTIFTLPFVIPIYGKYVNVLPILMSISTIVQQKLSTASTNPQQKMMMYLMPVMFFFIFNQFPSGLNLYYTLFNILSVLQQKFLPPKERPKKEKSSRLKNLRQTKLRKY